VIRELAENANAYGPLGPGDERIVDPDGRFVIWLGAGVDDPHWSVVQRLRLDADALEETVAEIRSLVRSRGRRSCSWEIADSATPVGLVDWLLAHGCERDAPDGVATGMVLEHPPAGEPDPGVEVRRVETLDDLLEAARIGGAAFGMPPEVLAETVAETARTWDPGDDRRRAYLAFVDGRPVARATASFTEHGALLFGGATLADARGRGAYRALVRARWEDAAARGTPVVVTHAGARSQPILARLGFRSLSRIDILVDHLAA
jgi:GNAT superfamily N-acetyltransferase